MRRSLLPAAIGLIVTQVVASPDILPVAGVAGTVRYDYQTGKTIPDTGLTRYGESLWASTQFHGYFWGGQGCYEIALDWGDIAGPAHIGGFGFSYATNADAGTTVIVAFYADDNGWNSAGRVPLACLELTGLAGTITPENRDLYWTWVYEVDIPPFVIDANDLDGDGLGDFSYTYWFDCATISPPGCIAGPVIAGDPNAGTAPGIEHGFDVHTAPDYSCDDPNLASYLGTYWFPDGKIEQFYMELFAADCPNRGTSGSYCSGDIALPRDCIVNVRDLAECLGRWGEPGCCIDDPFFCLPGHIVGLGDLAELLSQYGDDCNWPQP